ncbi:MAG: hypothetical protein SF051_04550 [Elusimicrobiota bacterium]|nr:hypothetical protein [Elusimicrobiota bacterium]
MFALLDWDWRPLARLLGWAAIAWLLARRHGIQPLAEAASFLSGLLLMWLLFLGVLTHLIAIVAMGAVRVALYADEVAYDLSERLIRPVLGPAPFAVRFLAAFSTEIALVSTLTWVWRNGKLATVLVELLR